MVMQIDRNRLRERSISPGRYFGPEKVTDWQHTFAEGFFRSTLNAPSFRPKPRAKRRQLRLSQA
jgi:hypothetical protein